MKDRVVIKAVCLLMGSALKKSLPVLGAGDSKAFWKDSKKGIPERNEQAARIRAEGDLKINSAHGAVLGAAYEACGPEPGIYTMTKFYGELFLRQRIILAALKQMDMLKLSEVRRQAQLAKKETESRTPVYASLQGLFCG